MKKISLILTIMLLCPLCMVAQKLLAKVPIPNSGVINNVHGFVLGDSIFLSYEASQSIEFLPEKVHSMIINPDGSIQRLVIPELSRKAFVNITDNSDSLFFNFLEKERNKIHFKTIAMSKKDGKRSLAKSAFIVKESIIGNFYENGYILVTVNERDSTLNFNRIIKNSLRLIATYKLPPTIFKKGTNRSLAFIYESDRILAPAALAGIKIYCNSNEIIVTEKASTFKADEKGTIVTRINRSTGKSESKFFKLPSVGFNSSFFIGEDLFWIQQKKGLQIIVSNWNQNLNTTYVIDRNASYINEMSAVNLTVEEATKEGNEAFIAGYPNDDGSIYLKTGTRKLFKSGGPVPILRGFGLLTFALAVTSVTTRALDEGTSYDFFFYLKKDSTGFSYTQSTSLFEQKVTSFKPTDPRNYLFDYFKSQSGIIGLYGLYYGKDREFEIVKFDYKQ